MIYGDIPLEVTGPAVNAGMCIVDFYFIVRRVTRFAALDFIDVSIGSGTNMAVSAAVTGMLCGLVCCRVDNRYVFKGYPMTPL